MSLDWFVYLLRCADGTYYAGIARDVERRLAQHNAGRGAKYVRGRTPAVVLTSCGPLAHGDALRLERAVKREPRAEKRARLEAEERARREAEERARREAEERARRETEERARRAAAKPRKKARGRRAAGG